jgi:hypothetical protein
MRNKGGLIGLLIVIVVLLIIGFFWFIKQSGSGMEEFGCLSDSDCVEDNCCHATGCVLVENAPNCSEISCSEECRNGTLDCNQGNCQCIGGKCGSSLE